MVHEFGEVGRRKLEEDLVAPATAWPFQEHDIAGDGTLQVAVGDVLFNVIINWDHYRKVFELLIECGKLAWILTEKEILYVKTIKTDIKQFFFSFF